MDHILKARSPAKLILSGEHSVLYDQPAIAMAVNRYTEATATWGHGKSISFNLSNLGYAASVTIQTLAKIKKRLQDDYHDFLSGNCSIKEVLTKPFELLQYSVSSLLELLNFKLPRGLNLKVNSNIPIGCGMGSSAASIISTLYVVSKILDLEFDPKKILSLSRKAENLQHGKSSGLDLNLVTYGGCKSFIQDKVVDIILPDFPFYIINTGPPESFTGECVSSVATHFRHDKLLCKEFGNITEEITLNLINNNLDNFINSIKVNHKLLTKIGVVPYKITKFIAEIESHYGAAKICGAGSVRGNSAGIILVVMEQKELLAKIADKYKFSLETIEIDNYGTKII